MTEDEQDLLALYEKLREGLMDMIDSDRLTEIDIPDDFEWLTRSLGEADRLHSKVRAVS